MKDHVAILIKDQKKFLFIKRSKHKKTLPNIWAFPSGTKEENETIEETAKREAFEELDVLITSKKFLTVKELPEFRVRLHFLICEINSGIPRIKEMNEIDELEWLTFSEFFNKYADNEIGHGLIFLRKNPAIWKEFA
ncbi:MAG: NUDIX domain-containing protein [Candidatus Nanoarchaeia archaeon]